MVSHCAALHLFSLGHKTDISPCFVALLFNEQLRSINGCSLWAYSGLTTTIALDVEVTYKKFNNTKL